MKLFFFKPENLQNEKIILEPAESKHVAQVLRKKIGETIQLTCGDEKIYEGEIVSLQERAEVRILSLKASPLRPPFLALGQSMLKNARMDWLIEKATELGVDEIYPFRSERTVIQLESEQEKEKRRLRFEQIAISALKQSQRGSIPQIQPISTFQQMLHFPSEKTLRLFFTPHFQEQSIPLSRLVEQHLEARYWFFLIGPEGGFSGVEAEEALRAGFQPVCLGSSILRGETAALKAIAVLSFLKEEKKGIWPIA